MKKNETKRVYSVLLGIGFVAATVAICFFVFHIPDFWPQLLAIIASAFLGAGATAWITKSLLKDQQKSEEEKERRTKVFEEKLQIYQNFLHCLYEVIKDGEVTKEEAIRLEFQTSYITMHTKSEHVKEIAEQVKNIVESLKYKGNPDEKVNDAETLSKDNEQLMNCLFNIVEQFKEELYQTGEASLVMDENTKAAVKSFSSIMDAVEVKQQNTELSIEAPENLNNILKEFTDELVKRIVADDTKWKFNIGELKEGVYLNYAWKGKEEDMRVLIEYEKNGEHYFAVHLSLEDTDSHEIYKHMKWRFSGRQNKWCWWKYVDTPNLVEEILRTNGNHEKLLSSLANQFKELLKYVESFERVHREIYQKVSKNKDDVRMMMYYDNSVVFENKDKSSLKVILKENGYEIQIDNNEKHYFADEKLIDLTPEEAVVKVNGLIASLNSQAETT